MSAAQARGVVVGNSASECMKNGFTAQAGPGGAGDGAIVATNQFNAAGSNAGTGVWNIHDKNVVLTDNAQTYGVILLNGQPQVFFDRIDKGDAKWNSVLDDPWGKVRYLLVAYNPRSGDLIQRHYPQINAGTVPGITPVYRTDRYVLARVADRKPGTSTTTQQPPAATSSTSTGSGG